MNVMFGMEVRHHIRFGELRRMAMAPEAHTHPLRPCRNMDTAYPSSIPDVKSVIRTIVTVGLLEPHDTMVQPPPAAPSSVGERDMLWPSLEGCEFVA